MHPVLLTGGLRQTPKEGIVIGGRYIPGHITVCAPRHITSKRKDMKSPRKHIAYSVPVEICFPQPCTFIPERWHTQPELVKDPRTYVPFGLGISTVLNLFLVVIR